MFAIGHLALGYITGKTSEKSLNVKMNLPLVLVLSILHDTDFLVPFLPHRGPTHSIILLLVIALPFVLLFKKQTIPYLAALLSHPILGDYLTRTSETKGGVQLFYPISSSWFAAGSANAIPLYMTLEVALFLASWILIAATKDIKTIITPHPSNLLLSIPILTTLVQLFTQFPIPIPQELIIQHLILIGLLTIPILIDIRQVTCKTRQI